MIVALRLILLGVFAKIFSVAVEIKGYHVNNAVYKESPPMILFSIFMGDIMSAYDHLELTIDSMRYNPQVDYILINIIEPMDPAVKALNELVERLKVPNFRVISESMAQFATRVDDRIHIVVPFEYGTRLWGRKMCDYKPTLAFLYSELLQEKHKYWGYTDNDVIWGNINTYADWMNGPNRYNVIYSVMWTPGGYLTLFDNAPWSIR